MKPEFRIRNGNILNHHLPTDFYVLRIDLTKATFHNYLNNNLYGAVKCSKTRHSGESRSPGFVKGLDSGFRRNDYRDE